ncbi:hypothetical protein F383_25015 [Gossypium arboreum]|uniref:Uncharacterized protein n=1 Tax=Gossypium arboreum TaxID=29729 RepID=A0A0B0NYU3_GOSAR|nr:hypothetical protein F383_25015 [Gossypium arboreum]
MHKNNHIGP